MFITFEGPEGSGKTFQMAKLAEYLVKLGLPILTTREPGGTLIGDQVREVLFDHKNKEMHPRTELLLFQASRSQLVEQVILPNLAHGKIVLCDRYADSTIAYQGYGHQQFDLEQVRVLVNFATGGLKPDLTLLLKVDVEVGLNRKVNGGEWNRLDAYQLDFHQRVLEGYLTLAKADPARWVMIDANKPPEEVQEAIQKIVAERLG
jgi:dTMP kinase